MLVYSFFLKTWEKAETRWMTSDKFLTRGVLIVCKSHIPSAIDLKAIMTMGGFPIAIRGKNVLAILSNLCLSEFAWE